MDFDSYNPKKKLPFTATKGLVTGNPILQSALGTTSRLLIPSSPRSNLAPGTPICSTSQRYQPSWLKDRPADPPPHHHTDNTYWKTEWGGKTSNGNPATRWMPNLRLNIGAPTTKFPHLTPCLTPSLMLSPTLSLTFCLKPSLMPTLRPRTSPYPYFSPSTRCHQAPFAKHEVKTQQLHLPPPTQI